MYLKTKVTVSGVDVTPHVLKWKYSESWGDMINSAQVKVSKSISRDVTVGPGSKIVITRGFNDPEEEIVFRGQVTKISQEGPYITLSCKDRLIECVKPTVTKSWDFDIDPEQGKISEIFKSLVNDYTSLTADDSSVQDSGSQYILKKFVMRNEDVWIGMNKLRKLLDWQISYDPVTDKVYFKPKGLDFYPTVLVVGDNIMNNPEWKEDIEELVNDVTVYGASQEDTLIETFTSSGQDTFIVSRTPEITEVRVDGVLKKRGVSGSTANYDYEVDKELKRFRFVNPVPAGSIVEIKYTTRIPVPVRMVNQTSVDLYGGEDKTPHQKTFYFTDILTVDDAEKKAKEILDKYSTPFVSTTVNLYRLTDVKVGMLVRVIDDSHDQNRILLVRKVVKEYPHKYDKIILGDREWRLMDWQVDVMEQIKKLYEEISRNQEILLYVMQLNHAMLVKRRVLRIYFKNLSGTTLVWGHSFFGIWGEFKWGTGNEKAFILGQPSLAVLGRDRLGETVEEGASKYGEAKYDDVNRWNVEDDGFILEYQKEYVCG